MLNYSLYSFLRVNCITFQSDAGSSASTPTFRQRAISQQDSVNSSSSRALSVASQGEDKLLCNGQEDEYTKQNSALPLVTNGK